MKKRYPTSALCLLAAAPQLSAQSIQYTSVTGTDTSIYSESGGVLTLDPSAPLPIVLQGSASAAGGNIELFASSDSASFDNPAPGSPFQSTSPTVLTVGFPANCTVEIRSLNGDDWFTDSAGAYNTSYGASNLANQWFTDFLGAMIAQGTALVPSLVVGSETALFNTFVSNGGFNNISDPNVSYVSISGNDATVGLAGFEDASNEVASNLGIDSSLLSMLFPTGIQVSEVAIIGNRAAYSFSAVNSGVNLFDPLNSYTGTYEVTALNAVTKVPEPSSIVLSLTALLLAGSRRKRS